MPRYRPSLECLETRCLLASVTPLLTITAGPDVVLGTSSKLTASATLANGMNPTGNILFTLADPNGGTVDAEVAVVNGNGSYTTPTGYAPSAAGTYQWTATYSGDTSNLTTTTGSAPEQVTATGLTLSTTPGASVVAGSGAALTDTALIAGGTSPTGTMTFTLTSPTGNVVDTETTPVTGNGLFSTPTGFVPTGPGTVTGTYTWTATFTGADTGMNSVTLTSTVTEQVNAAGTTLTNTPGAAITVGSNKPLTDTATLAGGTNPTGDILFTLTAPDGTIVDTEVVTINGNGTYRTTTGYPTNATTPTGVYKWTATYSGDANNAAVTSAAASESFTQPVPKLTIIPGGTVRVNSGKMLTASARLRGASSPTGTITFYLFAPGVTPNATDSNSVYSAAVTVTANGKFTVPTGYTPPGGAAAAGTYDWLAVYSGDSKNGAVTSAVGTEKFTLPHPTLTSQSGGAVFLGRGKALTDTVTLTGGADPTGTLTFYLFPPGVTPNTNGAGAVLISGVAVTQGKTTYKAPKVYVPTREGNYVWLAVYSGDANNGSVASSSTQAVENLRWQRS